MPSRQKGGNAVAKCAYCGEPLPGNERICRACWDEQASNLSHANWRQDIATVFQTLWHAAPLTSAIIVVNCAAYILLFVLSNDSLSQSFHNWLWRGADPFSLSSDLLLSWGADYAPRTLHGEYWRLFTAMFLHAGFFHLISNMLALSTLGLFLERAFGWQVFLATYIVTGVSASISGSLWHPQSVIVGASGAIFGLAGCLISLLALRRLFVFIKRRAYSVAVFAQFVLINVGFGMIVPFTDNAGHLGGTAVGLLVGGCVAMFCRPRILRGVKGGQFLCEFANSRSRP